MDFNTAQRDGSRLNESQNGERGRPSAPASPLFNLKNDIMEAITSEKQYYERRKELRKAYHRAQDRRDEQRQHITHLNRALSRQKEYSRETRREMAQQYTRAQRDIEQTHDDIDRLRRQLSLLEDIYEEYRAQRKSRTTNTARP